MNTERKEHVLRTIDQLGVVTVRQLSQVLKMGSYRNVCKIVSQLEEYLNVVRSTQKIVYLNKEGRQLIGSEKEVKKSMLFDHMLLANDAFIYYDCPQDWKREYTIEIAQEPQYDFGIQIKGVTLAKKKTIIPDAVFAHNWYHYLVEIDNTRTMLDNKKKIQRYNEMWEDIKKHFGTQVKLCIFTTSEKRKEEFKKLCGTLPHEVWTFAEI